MLIKKLEMWLRQLKVSIAFCQLDDSVAGAIPATVITEPIKTWMGAHSETLSFIVAPGWNGP